MRIVFALFGGLLLGLAIGIFIVGAPLIATLAGVPLLLVIGIAIIAFVGGLLIGRLGTKEQAIQPPRFGGRVFEFPQGPLLVEIALKRAGYVVKRRG